MNCSTTTTTIFKSIATAQGEFKTVEKSASNPHFKSKFAPLDNIIEMLRPVLPKHGLSFLQFTDTDETGIIVETVIAHESGEWVSGRLRMPAVKQDPQGYGSALTYGRRYGLAAAFGIVSDEDVDGNGPVSGVGSGGKTNANQQSDTKFINAEQLNAMRDILIMCGDKYTEAKFCADAKIKRLEDLPAERYQGAFNHVQAIAAKVAA